MSKLLSKNDCMQRTGWVRSALENLESLSYEKQHCYNLHFDAEVIDRAAKLVEQAYDLLDGMADAILDDREPL